MLRISVTLGSGANTAAHKKRIGRSRMRGINKTLEFTTCENAKKEHEGSRLVHEKFREYVTGNFISEPF